MSKKILFINPRKKTDKMNMGSIPGVKYPTSARYPASLTPEDWEIEIIDENVKRVNPDKYDADIVAFTSMTSNVPRAYELAKEFKKKGATTIIGGIHATLLPDEAQKYMDTVVVGEAESIWGKVIEDFENNKLQKRYKGERIPPEQIITPRKDIDGKNYLVENISTARGCPVGCDFCSVTKMHGGTYRQRPVEDILNEIENLDKKFFHFSSDNFLGYAKGNKEKNLVETTLELLKGMDERGLNKTWGAQTSINVADHEDILEWSKKTGATYFYIGFESVNEDSLKELKKGINVKQARTNYKEAIEKIHDYGIAVVGAIIVGTDHDTKDSFDEILDFVDESKVDIFQPTILTPLPRTGVFDKFNKQGRLIHQDFPEDWGKYDFCKVVYKPKNMEPEELEEGVIRLYKEANNLMATSKRTYDAWKHSHDPYTTFLTFSWNYGLKMGFERLLKSNS